ncbi:sensor histidine kinase [Dysosmobacter welbionis]|uniref:sensor histidine kinase n=1 Tax=Dysosmobacter welbionis TaxID=2093857 RepID=UPI003A936D3B
MKPFRSLRLRITLLCAVLLTLCCVALAVTNNLSAIQMADNITAVPLLRAQSDGESYQSAVPMLPLEIDRVVQQEQLSFHTRSLLTTISILVAGLLLIHLLVGRMLSPLNELSAQIQARTPCDLDKPISIPASGDEVAQLAQSFNAMSRRLGEAFLMQRSFSQNAAHEFRTPLAVLKTRIGLFRKKHDFAPQATEEYLSILEGEVDRLSSMVDSLLKLTNLEQVPREDRIGLDELVQQAAGDMAALAQKKHTSIVVAASRGTVTGSRELLRRALFNLAENAVKYGPEGGQVQLSASLEGETAIITVADQGPGIPQELRERVFEPFFRVDSARSRQSGGTGLGLALVRAIAELHGGSASVEEAPMGGVRFTLKIPVVTSK